MRLVGFVIFLFCSSQSIARADLIFNFEDQSGAGLTSLTYSNPELTLTITRSSNETFDIDNVNAAVFNKSLSPFNGIGGAFTNDVFRIELSRPVAAIFVDAGDFGQDADALRLEAFSGAGLTGSSSVWLGNLPGGGNNFSYQTMQVARGPLEPGFLSFAISGGDSNNSVFYDNFRFRLSAVPEPNACILTLLGTSLLGIARWRRQQTVRETPNFFES